MRIRRLPWLALAAAPTLAHASNGMRPRTPAVFPDDVPCVQTVTRGETLHIDYAAPFDDTDLGADELPDSRRYQFFAFAEQRYDFELPIWITRADYDRADANGDIVMLGDRPILEEDPSWPATKWTRITADDARIPITIAGSAIGVDWDTGSVAPGTWLVAAYTWEPEQNLWTPRFGAVRVVDPDDAAASGPTVFLVNEVPSVVRVGETYSPVGCIEAPNGATITASWGSVTGGATPQWIEFATDVPVESGVLDVTWSPGEDAIGSALVRVEITDAAGSYVAFTPSKIGVVAALDDGGMADDSSSTSSDASTTTSSASSSDEASSGTGQDDPAPSGCGCNAKARDPNGIAGLVALLFSCAAVRRRTPRTSAAPARAASRCRPHR